jgi:large subunit ribosomal protein L24
MTKAKLNIKREDTVKVLTGNDKGTIARVQKVIPKDRMVVVEGVNLKTKHRKPSTEFPDGGIFKMEAPIHISNVMLVDGGEAVKSGRKMNEKGKLQRFNKKTGDFIK